MLFIICFFGIVSGRLCGFIFFVIVIILNGFGIFGFLFALHFLKFIKIELTVLVGKGRKFFYSAETEAAQKIIGGTV